MRSRYTAYTLGHGSLSHATWHPPIGRLQLNLADDAATKWLGLEIRA
jgi:SEC-C motif-containing protein